MAESPIMTKRAYVGEAQPPTLPVPLASVDAWYLDPAAGTPQVRSHNGKVWAKDHTRTGSVRQMQPFRCNTFNGTSADHINGSFSLPELIAGNGFTVSQWILFGADRTGDLFYAKEEFGALQLIYIRSLSTTNLKFHFRSSDGVLRETTSTVNVAAGWRHVAATFANGSQKIYVDGIEIGSASIVYTTETLLLTEWAINNTTFSCACSIMHTNVWDRALTPAEIIQARDFEIDGNVLEIIGNEADGTVAFDSSEKNGVPNANHGTITAASLANFHDEPTTAPAGFRSAQNEIGYTEGTGSNGAAVGVFIPLVSPTLDALGNAAQYSGPCPHDGRLLGPCATFDGVDDFATGDASILPTSALAFSFWLKLTAATQWVSIINTSTDGSWNNGFGIFVNSTSGKLHAFVGEYTSAAITNDAVPLGIWVHVAVTWDGSTIRLYVNGESQTTTAAKSGTITHHATTFLIGTGTTTLYRIKGQLVGCNLYSVAKSQSEIQAIRSGEVDDTGLVERWHMQEPTGIVHAGQNGNDLDVSTASQANYHANQQDVFDYLSTQNGKRNPGQTLDIFGGEPNSPYALELAGLSVAQLQSFGDDDEPADPNTVVFAKVDAGGDGPIIVDVDAPGDTPQTTTLQGYT